MIKLMDLEGLQVPSQQQNDTPVMRWDMLHVATTVCKNYRPSYFLLVGKAVKQLEERSHGNSSLQKGEA